MRAEAREFKKRFNDFFWMEKEDTLAMGIDAHNQLIRSVSSDAGHCLMNDIVDDALRGKAAKRLMSEDMFSGWGVRTLSSKYLQRSIHFPTIAARCGRWRMPCSC